MQMEFGVFATHGDHGGLPLGQAEQVIPLATFSKTSNLEPASLLVVATASASSNGVLDDVLTGGGGLQLGLSSETASDNHAGGVARGGRAETAGGHAGG